LKWIDGPTVQQDFVVEMGTRHAAGRPDEADDGAALDLLSGADGKAGKMTEPRRDTEAMLEQDGIAVVALVPG
jgi:hypothetical protein